jgi:hypothetical protein
VIAMNVKQSMRQKFATVLRLQAAGRLKEAEQLCLEICTADPRCSPDTGASRTVTAGS